MSDWTAGYVADIAYTFGYYNEINPLRVKLAFLNQGLVFPNIKTACELGFGQGLSTNIHAASSAIDWYGTDFNPAQASFAQELVQASSASAKLYDESFAEFAHRADLPDFDYIALHGIWTWISDTNREVIIDFVRRKLKVGGVLYISYNTMPGWSGFAPMRHLMAEHANVFGVQGRGIVSRVDGALDFSEQLLATNPLYLRANPSISERLKKTKEHNRHYLAHEYFNQDWQPMHFSAASEWFQRAKLQFACSAHYFDHVDAINLTSDQQNFLRAIPDKGFKETVRDFMVNQQFRRDYWVKGARRYSATEQAEALRQQKLILTNSYDDVSLKITGSLGEASMDEAVYRPILDVLSDHRIHSLGQVEQTL